MKMTILLKKSNKSTKRKRKGRTSNHPLLSRVKNPDLIKKLLKRKPQDQELTTMEKKTNGTKELITYFLQIYERKVYYND